MIIPNPLVSWNYLIGPVNWGKPSGAAMRGSKSPQRNRKRPTAVVNATRKTTRKGDTP
jgi:hypothetical protein